MKYLAVLPYEHIEDNTIGNTADSRYFKNGYLKILLKSNKIMCSNSLYSSMYIFYLKLLLSQTKSSGPLDFQFMGVVFCTLRVKYRSCAKQVHYVNTRMQNVFFWFIEFNSIR